MTTSIIRRTSVGAFPALSIANAKVAFVVIPQLGGRVWEATDISRRQQWIWHREDVRLAAVPPGSSYDDVWAGGWEELFPNDAAGHFEGRVMLDHGSWWTTAWTVADMVDGAEGIIRLVAETQAPRTRCIKEFRLGADSSTLHANYRIESCEHDSFHFLFKQHLPVALSPSCRLVLPGGRITPVDPTFSLLLAPSQDAEWPIALGQGGESIDLSKVPPRSSKTREFVYLTEVPEGWCGVDDHERGAALRMHYDRSVFPFVWLFLTYGGWRNCYTAVLEPCTNMPKDLAAAAEAGRSGYLAPGGIFETRLSVTLIGLDHETHA